jgi:type II secretory pathway component GspD/PulD (secretin)
VKQSFGKQENMMKVIQGILAVALGTSTAGVIAPMTAVAQDAKEAPQEVRTLYLANATSQSDLNDIQSALRNMLPRAKIYGSPSEGAITVRASAEDLQIAAKLISDLDRQKKLYRLTYTITDSENGKRIGTQHCAITIPAGGKTDLKQGSKVPVVTGSYDTGNAAGTSNTQVQYLDLGLEIEAHLEGDIDGIKLYSKIVQSSVADEKSIVGAQDPVIRQTVIEGASTLTVGKPMIVGSIDITGSTRHQDVEVVAEQVK